MVKWVALSATWRCNLKCKYCSIWKSKDREYLDISELEKQFKASNIQPNEIAVFGGEPTLHPDLVGVYRVLDKLFPNACKSIVTNGFNKAKEKLLELSKYSKKIITCVSVDGDRETHNRHRGNDDSYDDALATLAICKRYFIRSPRISFTITPDNIKSIPRIVEIARVFDSDISMRTATCGSYFNGEIKINWNRKDIDRLESELAKVPKGMVCHPGFVYEITNYLRTGRHYQCIAPFKSIAVDPNLDIRICHSREPICQLKDIENYWYKDKRHKETFNGSCFKNECFIDGPYSLAYL